MKFSKIINQLINHKNIFIFSCHFTSDAVCNSEDNDKDFQKYKYRNFRHSRISKIVINCSNFQVELQIATIGCLCHMER